LINEAEALVVRNGSGINKPEDLRGKKIGVPFVSTTHYHLLYALELWGISPGSVEILNMQPNQIAAAWARGDIDAGFAWGPAQARIKETGKVLIDSGELRVDVAERFPLAELADVHAKADAGDLSGKVVVVVDNSN
jgi:taurine transport system substrate-binding protein